MADHPGVRAGELIDDGVSVRKGQTLFRARRHPEICFVAPASGTVELDYGAQRRLRHVVIHVADAQPQPFETDVEDPTRVRSTLLAAGLWPALRSRPFDRIPAPDASASSLFVTAIDTHPLAPDPATVIAASADAFEHGLFALSHLAQKAYVCVAPRDSVPVGAVLPAGSVLPTGSAEGLTVAEFDGPHPAGLPSTHMYHLAPSELTQGGAWHIGYQDVLSVGRLFLTGVADAERVISIAGPGVETPKLVRTCLGADVRALVGAETRAPILVGSVLSGREATASAPYLGRYDRQVTMLTAPPPRSGLRGLIERLVGKSGNSGMLPVDAFDRVWPFGFPVAVLLRALLLRDDEMVERLGYEWLTAEDFALISYLCPAGIDYGAALDATVEPILRARQREA